jgi:glucokinase
VVYARCIRLFEVHLLAGQEKSVLTYDVGGSHVSAAVFDHSTGRLGSYASARYPTEQSTEAFLQVLFSLADEATADHAPILGASLAMPGPFDYIAGISWMKHKLTYLYGFDLRNALAKHFGLDAAKVRFLNDAAAFAWGEVGGGAARDVERAVGITLGTGIGSGFAIDGKVVTEGPGVPPGGEIWNLPYKDATVEDRLSTRAIQNRYREQTGLDREVSVIAASAPTDPVATEVFAEFGLHLGETFREILSPFAPQVVVLGGGISRSSQLFLPAAYQGLAGMQLELRPSILKDQAPLVGAGVSWFSADQSATAAS